MKRLQNALRYSLKPLTARQVDKTLLPEQLPSAVRIEPAEHIPNSESSHQSFTCCSKLTPSL